MNIWNETKTLIILSVIDIFTNKTIESLCKFCLPYTALQKMTFASIERIQIKTFNRQNQNFNPVGKTHIVVEFVIFDGFCCWMVFVGRKQGQIQDFLEVLHFY